MTVTRVSGSMRRWGVHIKGVYYASLKEASREWGMSEYSLHSILEYSPTYKEWYYVDITGITRQTQRKAGNWKNHSYWLYRRQVDGRMHRKMFKTLEEAYNYKIAYENIKPN